MYDHLFCVDNVRRKFNMQHTEKLAHHKLHHIWLFVLSWSLEIKEPGDYYNMVENWATKGAPKGSWDIFIVWYSQV